MRSVGVAVVVVLMVLRTAAQTEVNTDSTIDIATQMTIQTTIDCPMVTCWELCDWMIGSDGCPTCDCPSTCERATCGPFSKCIPNNNCPSCYSCIPDTTTTPRTTTVECPVISCAPNCFPNFTPQPDGCFTCDCYPTCNRDTTCSQGETCVMQYECANCIGVPTCVPDTTTTTTTTTNATKPPCPIPLCLKECPPVRGPDGCLNCVCLNCQNLTCDSGEECVMQGGDCSPEEMPCVPHPTCVPLYATTTTPCPLIRCAPGWESTTGPGGCPTCVLLPSCQDVNCDPGYVCELHVVECFTKPCYPQPTCVPVRGSCAGLPNTRRCRSSFVYRWTYRSLTDTCQRFRYYGCTPSLNTYRSRTACLNRCSKGSQPICAVVDCKDNCYTYRRKNGCPKCICPNPCNGYECPKGYECKLEEARSDNIRPEPFCHPSMITQLRPLPVNMHGST